MDHSVILGTCSRCQNEVAKERLENTVVVCNHCGFTSEENQDRHETGHEKKAVRTMVVISMVLVATFVHVANWGSNAVVIIPLKMKEIVGLANINDLEEIVQICTAQSKAICVEQALRGLADKDSQNLENRAKLASFQSRLNKLNDADRNYAMYFAAGGIRPEAAYEYALVLEKLNRVDDAARMFDFALVNKPDVLQITVTQAYVRLLMNASRYKEARSLIDSIRAKGSNAKYFMEKEYAQILTASR